MASNVVNVFKKFAGFLCGRNASLVGVGIGHMGQVSFTFYYLLVYVITYIGVLNN
jgi:hypothetical protein